MDRNKKGKRGLREGGKITRRDKGMGTRNVAGRMERARSNICRGKKEVKGDWV